MDRDVTVIATFEPGTGSGGQLGGSPGEQGAPGTFLLAVNMEPLGSGTVSVGAGPGANCSCNASCRFEDINAAIVTLEAFPSAGFVFKSWAVMNQPEICPGAGPCDIAMDRDVLVVANFEPGTGGGNPRGGEGGRERPSGST